MSGVHWIPCDLSRVKGKNTPPIEPLTSVLGNWGICVCRRQGEGDIPEGPWLAYTTTHLKPDQGYQSAPNNVWQEMRNTNVTNRLSSNITLQHSQRKSGFSLHFNSHVVSMYNKHQSKPLYSFLKLALILLCLLLHKRVATSLFCKVLLSIWLISLITYNAGHFTCHV